MPNPLKEALGTMSELQIAHLYKTTFSSPDARLCLEDIKARAYRDACAAIDMNSGHLLEPHQTYLNLGMQALCLHIEGQIDYQPTQREESHE